MAGRQGNTNLLCNVLGKQDTKRAFKFKLATKLYKRTDFLTCTTSASFKIITNQLFCCFFFLLKDSAL